MNSKKPIAERKSRDRCLCAQRNGLKRNCELTDGGSFGVINLVTPRVNPPFALSATLDYDQTTGEKILDADGVPGHAPWRGGESTHLVLNFSFIEHTPSLDGAPVTLRETHMTFYDLDGQPGAWAAASKLGVCRSLRHKRTGPTRTCSMMLDRVLVLSLAPARAGLASLPSHLVARVATALLRSTNSQNADPKGPRAQGRNLPAGALRSDG